MDSKALYQLSYGMYVVGSTMNNDYNGQIANTVFQISSEPATIAISINKQNLTHDFIVSSKVFTVSTLDKETPLKQIGLFGFKSGRAVKKFKESAYKIGVTKAPIATENALSYLEAEVVNAIDVVTHTVFVGKIVAAEVLKVGEPMTYAYYHEVKRGLTPKQAPTYINPAGNPG
jgi:flavin reductase (DIM6/NTAB) family NADH-FMN oxidoreductase RutF